MQGFLLLNKPSGMTSFGAVAAVKRLTGEKRVGHTGTLDPMATGVLPIFIGKATALASCLSDESKRYTATVRLGVETDTLDITGNVISTHKVDTDPDSIGQVIDSFKGVISQVPPIYSAIKQNGVRLYSLARQGKSADIPARRVEIFDISLICPLDRNNEFSISVCVSKGTYIRSLARDIGKALGCGAVLSALERTAVSGFDIKDCVGLDLLTPENIGEHIKREDEALFRLDSVGVTQKQALRFSNGGKLSLDRLPRLNVTDGQILKVYYQDIFLGLGIADPKTGMLAIKCNINKP